MRQYLGPGVGLNLDTVWVQTWTQCGSKLGHDVGPNLDLVWVQTWTRSGSKLGVGANLDTEWVQTWCGSKQWTRCGSKLGHGVGPNLDKLWVSTWAHELPWGGIRIPPQGNSNSPQGVSTSQKVFQLLRDVEYVALGDVGRRPL